MKRISAPALFFIFCAVVSVAAQNGIDARVDEFVKAEMAKQKIPGVSLAVVKDGKPLIVKGYGFANLEHQVPVKPETIFQSGSVGKQFTAFAVLLLVEDGRIWLDDKIGKHLGDVPEAWANITVRHLLTHTSGMTDYPNDFDFRKDYTEDELFKLAKEIPLAFAPGEKWQYSNLGYVTLGFVIRKASGKFYGDFLHEKVFRPLGMTTARVISETDIITNRAAGYVIKDGEWKNQAWVSPTLNTTADGALYMNALDMIKWDEALTGGKLLGREMYEQMWKPVKLNNGKDHPYGFGWGVKALNGKRLIEHGGAWQGFKTHIARFPDDKLTIIVFANLGQANQARLAHGVAGIVDPSVKPKPIPDPDPNLTAELRQLVEAVLKSNIDQKRFTPRALRSVTNDNDRLLARVKALGPPRKFERLESTDAGEGTLYRYKVEFESMTVTLEIAKMKDGKIGFFEIHPE